ncbi:MAG: DUF4279 domain-containing protein [Sedimentibacter sp.]
MRISIGSNGELDTHCLGRGFIGYERGIFNPDDITKILGIQPFKCWKKGDNRSDGSQYLFSS